MLLPNMEIPASVLLLKGWAAPMVQQREEREGSSPSAGWAAQHGDRDGKRQRGTSSRQPVLGATRETEPSVRAIAPAG